MWGMPHGQEKGHMNNVNCDGILSCGCSHDEDSS